MSEFRIDIKTSGDDGPIKKVQSAQEALNKAITDGLALPIDRELSAEEDAYNDVANAAAAAGEAVEKFIEKKKRLTETSTADAFKPNAGLATGDPNLGNFTDPQFVVQTQAQVEAIEQNIAALERRITVTQAAGESALQYELLLGKLNGALQTEEAKALLAARAEEELAEAQRIATQVAEKEDAVRKRKEEADAVKELVERKRDLQSVARGLSIEVPLVGRALRFLTNPISLAVGSVTLLITGLRALWVEINRREQFSAAAVWANIAAAADKMAASANNAAVGSAAYARELQVIADAQDSITQSTDKVIGKIREEARARMEIVNAQAALQLAQIDAAEKSGKLTPVQAIQQRAQVTTSVEREKNKSESETAQKEIAAREAEKREIEAKISALVKRQKESAEEAELIKQREIANQERIDAAKKNIAAEKANRKKLEEELKKADESTGSALDKASPLTEIGRKIADLKQQIELSKTSEAVAQGIVASGKKTAVDRANDQTQSEEAASKAAKELSQNLQRLNELIRQIPELKERAQSSEQTRGTIQRLNEQRSGVQTQSQITEIQKQEAARAEQERERKAKETLENIKSGRPSAAAGDRDQAGKQFAEATGEVEGAIKQFSATVVSEQKQFAALVISENKQIKQELATIRSQLANSRV